jgi:serine/threonine protein kinase
LLFLVSHVALVRACALQAEPIGEGRYTEVFKGWWQGALVAVKVLKPKHCTPERQEELLREGARQHSIVHNSLLCVYGIVKDSGMCALVLPLVGHGSLRSAFAGNVPGLVSSVGALQQIESALCSRQLIASSLLHYCYSKKNQLSHLRVALILVLLWMKSGEFACALTAWFAGDGGR